MFLGVMINQSLSWSSHIDLVSSITSKEVKSPSGIAWLLLKHVFVASTRATCYHTSHVRHCLAILHMGGE